MAASMDVDMTGTDVKSAAMAQPFARPSNYQPAAMASVVNRTPKPLFTKTNPNYPYIAKMSLIPETATAAQRQKTFESAVATRLSYASAAVSATAADSKQSLSTVFAELKGNPFLKPLIDLTKFDPDHNWPTLALEFLLYSFILAEPDKITFHADRLANCLIYNSDSLSDKKYSQVVAYYPNIQRGQPRFILMVLNDLKRVTQTVMDADLQQYFARVEKCYTEPADVQPAVLAKALQIFRVLAADPIYGIFVVDIGQSNSKPFEAFLTLPSKLEWIYRDNAAAAKLIVERAYECVRKAWLKEGVDQLMFDNNYHLEPRFPIRMLITDLQNNYANPQGTYITAAEIRLAIELAEYNAERCLFPNSLANMPKSDKLTDLLRNDTAWRRSFLRLRLKQERIGEPLVSLRFLLYSFAIADPSDAAVGFIDKCVEQANFAYNVLDDVSLRNLDYFERNVIENTIWHLLTTLQKVRTDDADSDMTLQFQSDVERCITKPYADGTNAIGETARKIYDRLTDDPTYGIYLIDTDPFRRSWIPFQGFAKLLNNRSINPKRLIDCIRQAWMAQPILRNLSATKAVFAYGRRISARVPLLYDNPAGFEPLPTGVSVADIRRSIEVAIRNAELCYWPESAKRLPSYLPSMAADETKTAVGFAGVSGISASAAAAVSRPYGTSFSAATNRPTVPIGATGLLTDRPFVYKPATTMTDDKNGGTVLRRRPIVIGRFSKN